MNAINPGIWLHNPAPCPDQATIATTGLGRSGTTMVARVLSELGIFMGQQVTFETQEDKEFQTLVKAKNIDGFAALCRSRDVAHARWGLKVPALRSDLNTFASCMRNPRLIVTFRDALAVALRNTMSMGGETATALAGTARDYLVLARRVADYQGPVLAISYEKSLQFPKETASAVAEFCGLAPDERTVNRAASAIQNSDPRYLGLA